MLQVGGPLAATMNELRNTCTRERARLLAERTAMPSISEFFSGRHVLITGGSGFLGRLIIEMLLRCCPDIGNIYVVLRSRRGVPADDRIHTMVDVPVSTRQVVW